MTKVCSKCGKSKPLSEFHRQKASKDGRYASCKQCRHIYYETHRERILKNCAEWRATNPEKLRETHRRYHKSHRKQILENARRYRQSEKGKATRKAWLARQRKGG